MLGVARCTRGGIDGFVPRILQTRGAVVGVGVGAPAFEGERDDLRLHFETRNELPKLDRLDRQASPIGKSDTSARSEAQGPRRVAPRLLADLSLAQFHHALLNDRHTSPKTIPSPPSRDLTRLASATCSLQSMACRLAESGGGEPGTVSTGGVTQICNTGTGPDGGRGTRAMPSPTETLVEGHGPQELRPESGSADRHNSMHGHALASGAVSGHGGLRSPLPVPRRSRSNRGRAIRHQKGNTHRFPTE